jgi:tripartite-type tricarboxylate transporter receptor subunit TctC
MPGRRRVLAGAAGLAAGAGRGAQPAAAWEPERPIQLVVGFAPGGGADLAARAIAEAAAPLFPAPLVVVNRPGAGGAIAAQQVSGMPPDGLNLLVGGGSESISLPAFRDLPYDPKRSFRAVIRLTRQPLLVVARRGGRHADLRAAAEAARRAPGTVSHASSGQGSIYHAVFVLLSRAAGIELLHVPFTGGAPSLQALLAGTVELAVLAPEDLLLTKATSFDEATPHYWYDALALLAYPTLDWDYLLRRASHGARRMLGLLLFAQSNDLLVPDTVIAALYRRIYPG